MTLDYTNLAIIGAIAYAIGNISPSIIIGKIYGVDIRKEGSGNAGTTNTIRVIGLTAGLICLFVDVLKGFVAVTVGYNMGDLMGSMVAFACVILGHCFPVIWKFKGGKGVASAFGAGAAAGFEAGAGFATGLGAGAAGASVSTVYTLPLTVTFVLPASISSTAHLYSAPLILNVNSFIKLKFYI